MDADLVQHARSKRARLVRDTRIHMNQIGKRSETWSARHVVSSTAACLAMARRIQQMRRSLRAELERLGAVLVSGGWSHIETQIGMFGFTGLNQEQLRSLLRSVEHVRVPDTGWEDELGRPQWQAREVRRSWYEVGDPRD